MPNLKQGSKLSIRSQLPPDIKLTLEVIPQWRDDGHLIFQQFLPRGQNATLKREHEATMDVQSTERSSGQSDDVEVTIGLQRLQGVSELQPARGDSESMQGRIGFANRNYAAGENDRPDLYMNENKDETFNKSNTTKDCADSNDDGDNESLSGIILTAKVPEKLDLSAKIESGDIVIQSKLEGDMNVHTANGDVRCSKLRGEKIDIYVGNGGIVHASNLIEAETLNINLAHPGRLRAKMISVKDCCVEVRKPPDDQIRAVDSSTQKKLDVDDALAIVDVSSLYCTGDDALFLIANDEGVGGSTKRVRIKYNHGHVSVRASTGTNSSNDGNAIDEYGQQKAFVELGGVNGSCDVVIDGGIDSAVASNGKPASGGMSMLAAKVHVDSLTPNSISMVNAHSGDVALSLDRKQELDLRLLSGEKIESFDADVLLEDSGEILSSALSSLDLQISQTKSSKASTYGSAAKRISIATSAFEREDSCDIMSRLDHVEFVQGLVKNVSMEKDSRFDVKVRGAQGKVDISGAAAQALDSFKGSSSIDVNQRPLFAVSASERITVDTLSWIGAIARRYGMKDSMPGSGEKADAPLP